MKDLQRIALALLCFLPFQALAAASVVQTGSGQWGPTGTSTTCTVTLTSVVSGNSLIAASGAYGQNSPPDITVSDGTGFTEAARGTVTKTDASSSAEIHYRHNVSSGTHSVVFTTNAASGQRYGWCVASEVSGLVNTTPNQTASNNADSSSPTSGTTAATTVANTFIVAVMNVGQATADAGIDTPATTGYTNRFVYQDVNTEQATSVDTKSVSSTGAQSAAWGTLSAAMAWCASIAAFEETGGGGGGSAAVPVFMHHYNSMRH